MKIYAQFNIIIVDSIRINIVLLKYSALYFTYPLEKHDFSHVYLSPTLESIIKFLHC